MFQRYAIYVTPAGPLADKGASWLGWDSAAGRLRQQPVVPGLDLNRITETPRKYGLHATIKPPFFLADETRPEQLQQAMSDLCAGLKPVHCAGLIISQMGRFIALTPTGNTEDLTKMAAKVVADLDMFRAPLTEAEVARRNPERLSPIKRENLFRWGYPHVMDAFRFHMTLTGRLQRDEQVAVMSAAGQHFGSCLDLPFVIDHLTLCGQDDAGLFHHVKRMKLAG